MANLSPVGVITAGGFNIGLTLGLGLGSGQAASGPQAVQTNAQQASNTRPAAQNSMSATGQREPTVVWGKDGFSSNLKPPAKDTSGYIACYPACATDPNATFPNAESAGAYSTSYEIVGSGILVAEGVIGLGRWALGRLGFGAARGVGEVIRLPQSLGAAAKEIFVRGGGRLVSRQITNVEKIAEGRGIREVGRLVEQYGGKAANWRKMKGIADVERAGGEIGRAEVHWYQGHGVGRVEFKVKAWLD
ncbi:MAG TPA: hypothetical protein VFQ61_04830 [Polyangiaceae bacterium]|nr:hypothetical protein [Polyangiaceae bacterium]